MSAYNFKPKDKFTYTYDFGDNWRHEILMEKVLKPKEGIKYPVCIKGNRNAPPEDIGGVWGYKEPLEVIGDLEHTEHEEMLRWVGESSNPEKCDLERINRDLAEFFHNI